jgi:hypothetical protein
VGLLTRAIDAAPLGAELKVIVDRQEDEASITIESTIDADHSAPSVAAPEHLSSDLTSFFARRFLGANGGRLVEGSPDTGGRGKMLSIHLPCLILARSPHPGYSRAQNNIREGDAP